MNTGDRVDFGSDWRMQSELTPERRSEKARQDFIIYLQSNYTIEGAIAKVVADYRLWRKTDLTPWEMDLVLTYNKVFPRGSYHYYI